MKHMKKILAICLALVMVLTCIPVANAATSTEATIDENAECSLKIVKYDWTNAYKDGYWDEDSFTSTGAYEPYVEDHLGNVIRPGDQNQNVDHILGNDEISYGYVIKGVEYSIVNIAKPMTFTEDPLFGPSFENIRVMQLYAFDRTETADLLAAIGLPNGKGRQESADYLEGFSGDGQYWYYQSDVINKAMASALSTNATVVKNALEKYVANNPDTIVMEPTNQYGQSHATGLDVGLYLVVETAVPEMVTSTTNPFFVSLPMTTVSGNVYSETPTGGHYWNYDVVVYPKNETGIPTLEKTVREAKASTGKNGGLNSITDGFSHNATGSGGDVVEYQIVSTLPTITSNATGLSMYTFYDHISEGLAYNQDVQIEIYTDKNCTDMVASWALEDGYFTVTYSDDMRYMSIDMTEEGLAVINGTDTAQVDTGLYQGYSNHTARITYSATIQPEANLVFGTEGNCNDVTLTWSRTSSGYYDALIDDCHVYSFGMDITKLFSDVDSETAAQEGMFQNVTFNIYNETDNVWVIAELDAETGMYYVTGYGATEEEASVLTPVSSEQGDGKVIIKGLEDDRYIVTELTTASGYTLLTDDIVVDLIAEENIYHLCDVYLNDAQGVLQNDPNYLTAVNTEGLELSNMPQKYMEHKLMSAYALVDGNYVNLTTDNGHENAEVNITVVNTRGFDLPKTGDVGTMWFTVAGVLVMAGAIAAIILISKKKKENTAQ